MTTDDTQKILAKLSAYDEEFKFMRAKLEAHDEEFKFMRAKLEAHDKRFDGIDQRLDTHEFRLNKLTDMAMENSMRLDRIEETMTTKDYIRRIEDKLDELLGFYKKHDQEFTMMHRRLERVEEKVGIAI